MGGLGNGMRGVDAAAKKKQDQTNFFEIHLTLLHVFYVLFHSDTWMSLSGTRTYTIQTRKQNLVTILFSIGIMVLFGFICVQLS